MVLRSDLGDRRSTVTDPTGSYSFTDLDPGNYQFEIIDLVGDFLAQYYPEGGYVAAAAGDSTELDFTLDQPAAVVQGVVTDEAGDPMPDQYVRLVTGSSLQSSSYRSVRTDASGAYRFGRLDARSYRVLFVGSATLAERWFENSSSFGGASLVDAPAGVPQTVDFVARERATVTGRITNEAGAPLANIKIRARAMNDSLRDVGLAYTDARGEFVLRPNVRDEIVLLVGPSDVYLQEYYPDASDVSAAQILDLSSTARVDDLEIVVSDNHPPTAKLNASTTVGFAPLTVTFEPNSVDFDSDPRTYTLSYADGSSPDTGSIPAGALTHTFDRPGSYLVRLEVDDGKATATDFATITVFDPTSLAADAGSDRIAEVGEPLRFSGGNSSPSGVIDSYAWDFADGQTASGPRVFHTFDTPGDYTVELVVAGAGSSATDQVAVSVVPQGTGTGLSVRVVDESSQPVAGAIVSVELPDGSAVDRRHQPIRGGTASWSGRWPLCSCDRSSRLHSGDPFRSGG